MKYGVKIVLIGLITGFLSGLFSSGGGLIAVPAFTHFLNKNEKDARAMTLFCIIPMVIISIFFYDKANLIDYKLGIICGIGGGIGGFLGSFLLGKLNDKFLQITFIIFLVYSSISLFLK